VRQPLNLHLTRADRESISRWRRVMLPAAIIGFLALLAADKAYQKLWPTASAAQVADEGSRTPQNIRAATRSAQR
jgi:hypothetical protein